MTFEYSQLQHSYDIFDELGKMTAGRMATPEETEVYEALRQRMREDADTLINMNRVLHFRKQESLGHSVEGTEFHKQDLTTL